jgi:ATP-dependent Clp protease ATP-binding subunit ClpB
MGVTNYANGKTDSKDPGRARGGAAATSPRLAQQGKLDPVIGRDEEIRRTIQILSRRTKNNPVLIGEAGVGKTAIVEGIAGRIAAGDVPESLRGKRLLASTWARWSPAPSTAASSRSA